MKKILSLLIVSVLLLSCFPGQVFADVMINNQIKNGENSAAIVNSSTAQISGFDMIMSTGDQNTISMPNFYAYIQPVTMYVDAPGDHSIYVYRDLSCDKEKLMPFAYEGMRVMAVAEQKAKDGITRMTCIVYRDEHYRPHAGWVHSKYLVSWFPGAVESTGSVYTGTVYTAEDPILSWGRDYFVSTKQKYVVLTSPVRSCTQFRLNYQLTDRGGAKTAETLGLRTIYINDGSGWSMAGQFDYPKIQSVLVTVNLPEPTDIMAVAVIPSCARPDNITSRLAVQDVLTTGSSAYSGEDVWLVESGTPQANTATINNTVPAKDIRARRGSIVTYGTYEQDMYANGSREPIEWIVLDVQDNRLLLISRYGLDSISYSSRHESIAWETSYVRSWLNDQFLNAAFSMDERSGILLTEVDNSKSQGYIHYEGDGGNNTLDQIFLLSYAEAWNYFFQNADRGCRPTKAAVKRGVFESSISGNCPRWLRSPGYAADYVACVDVDGNRGCNLKYGKMAVRPAMWVDFSAVQSFGSIYY